MNLRVRIPQPIFLYAFCEDPLKDVSLSYSYRHYGIRLVFEGGTVEKATGAKPGDDCQWYRKATHAMLIITETDDSSHPLADLVQQARFGELLELIETVVMKTIRVIRTIGVVPELPESLPSKEPITETLHDWHPEVSHDGGEWTVLPTLTVKERMVLGLLGFAGRAGFSAEAEMDITRWDRIKEVLEDDLPIQPEDEFLTNTIGHLRTRNLRLAVVDAVIGLEIVLARYLQAYLSISKGLSKSRIKEFLRTDFGLTARLAGLLNLTLHESYLKDIDLEQVLHAVGWRNYIVHKTGRLPEDIPTERVRAGIQATLHLARTLAELYVTISATPDRDSIAKQVKAKWSNRIGWPSIWIQPWHRVVAEVSCWGDSFTREEMKAIAEDLGSHLRGRDKRFELDTHLRMTFNTFTGDNLGTYVFGRVLLKGESLLKPAPPDDAANRTSDELTPSTPA
jgi:hypothetical protein